MGGLVQQVNLYRGQKRAEAPSDSTRVLLAAGVGAVCFVLVLAAAGEFYLSRISTDRNAVAGELKKREASLARYTATLMRPEIDPFLEAEMVRLHQVRDRLNQNLAAIARQMDRRREGFAAYFSGLARNTLDGLWFQNVVLSSGGEEMFLKGRTIEPELVPRLLQTLATEQVFAGRTFRKVSFERLETESGALIDFELRSAQLTEVDDAG